jgi:hypothetical protein
MPSPAAAWADAGRHHNRSGNDDNGLAVRTASAVGTAVKTHAAATRHLDDQIGRSLAGGKRHRLRGTARKSQNKSKSDKLVHAFLLGFFCATRSWAERRRFVKSDFAGTPLSSV